MRFRLPFFAINLCVLFMMGACGSGSSNSTTASNGFDESQFYANPSLRADLTNVVAVHLEHPSGGAMSEDTDVLGTDVIPYFIHSPISKNVEFCFAADLPHSFSVLNAQGVPILQIEGTSCGSAFISLGNYSFVFNNAEAGGIEVLNFFIRQDPLSATPRILINQDCQNCDLSGLQMRNMNVSNRDFSGSNFDNAQITGDDFRGSNLADTSFDQANFTGSLFDATGAIFAGEQVIKEWDAGDGDYALKYTLNYASGAQFPQINLVILQSGNEIFNQNFDSNNNLQVSISQLSGNFSARSLNLATSEDAGIWADFCWGASLENCFEGVMISFNAFGTYANESLPPLAALSTSTLLLNFINASDSLNNDNVVIFQKNNVGMESSSVAWRVLENVGAGDNHPFEFSLNNEVAASDSYGNFTPLLSAFPGQLFAMILGVAGDELVYQGAATSTQEIQVINNLTEGAIDANIFKDGLLLAVVTGMPPAQKAVFGFKPTLWIGNLNQVVQGQVMDSTITSTINTQLSLLGIARADIVMTGGASGQPFQFNMENIVFQ